MDEFEATGRLGTPAGLVPRCSSVMKSARLSEAQVLSTIRETYEKHNYLLDPHSAIGVGAAEQLRAAGQLPSDSETTTVCLACAHWGKFPDAVGKAIGKDVLANVPAPELVSVFVCFLCRWIYI
jgi:threonine synthase